MSTIYEPTLCPQCRSHSAKFEQDRHAGGYDIRCSHCGHHETHRLDYDEEGIYSGYTHVVRKGAGILFFRHAGEHFFHRHLLNTPKEVIAAERWLRERLSAGTVDPETAFLTRWDGEANGVKVMVGEILDFLAGKIETVEGFPVDLTHDDCPH